MNNAAKKNGTTKEAPIPTPVPELVPGSEEHEVYLDILVRATEGYAGAAWTNNQKQICSMSPVVVARCAIEVADRVFAEYKKRLKK